MDNINMLFILWEILFSNFWGSELALRIKGLEW